MRSGSIASATGLIAVMVVALLAGPGGASSAGGSRASVKPAPGHLIVGQAISLPPALFEAGPVGSASLITPAQAADVTRAMWKLWESALVGSNTRALSQLVASGPVLQGTINNCALPVGTCVFETAPRPISALQMIVPLQQHYPLYFLAEVRTTEYVDTPNGLTAKQPWIEFQVLTKTTAKAPWKLSFDTGYNNSNETTPPFLGFDLSAAGPSTSAGGQEQYNPAPSRAPPVPASRFLSLLATYWQSYKDTGRAPAHSAFVTGYASGVGRQFAQNRQGSVYAGHRDTFRFTYESGAGTWQFSAYGGYPLVCGAVRDLATFTPLKGLLYQNPDESHYGVPLRAGFYRTITPTTEHETCVYVEPAGLEAVGNNVYNSRVTGVFAKKGPPSQTSSVLSDLETDYSVLAYQLAQYEKQLAVCVQRHADTACSKPFAVRAEHEFARFENRLGNNTFPPSARGQVDKLAATARALTKLFEELTTRPPTVAITTKIAGGVATLTRQYQALVHKLS